MVIHILEPIKLIMLIYNYLGREVQKKMQHMDT
jgi:hypothetical protein